MDLCASLFTDHCCVILFFMCLIFAVDPRPQNYFNSEIFLIYSTVNALLSILGPSVSAGDFWNRILRKLKITSCFQSKPWLRSESLMLEFLFHKQLVCWFCFTDTCSCWHGFTDSPQRVVLLMLFVYQCLLFYWCCLSANVCCFIDVICLPMFVVLLMLFVCQCLLFYWCYMFTDVCCFIDVVCCFIDVCLPMFVVLLMLFVYQCCFIDDYVYLLTAWGGPHRLDHESDPTRFGGTCIERH